MLAWWCKCAEWKLFSGAFVKADWKVRVTLKSFHCYSSTKCFTQYKNKVCGKRGETLLKTSTYNDVRLSMLWKTSTGTLFSPQFCKTKRFKLLRPKNASRSIESNKLSDRILRKKLFTSWEIRIMNLWFSYASECFWYLQLF